MKAFTKKFALGACALLAVSSVGFAACSGGGNGGGGGGGGTPSDIVTEVDPNVSAKLKIAYKAENKEKLIVQSLAEGFQKIYPNVSFEYVAYSDKASNSIAKFYKAGEMPDIFMSDSFSMLTLSPTEDLLLNLTPYIEKETEEGTFSLDEYYDSYMRLGQLDFDGVQYLIPRSADRVVCHVNMSLVKQAEQKTGKQIANKIHNGWTWTEFYEVCDLLKEAKVAKFLVDDMSKWEAVWNPIFQAHGVKYFDENGNVAIDSPETQSALDQFKLWVDRGYCASAASGQGADFEYGKGVFYFNSMAASYEIDKLMIAYEDDPDKAFTLENANEVYDVVTFPVDEKKPLIGAGIAGYCGYGETEHPELVWKFMKFMLSKDGQNAIADSGTNYVPVRKDMADYTDSENNHWGKGYEKINLSAYTYMSGGYNDKGEQEADWNCCTDYFKIKGSKYAVALNDGVSSFVTNYAGGLKNYTRSVNDLNKTWKAALAKK